MTETDTELDKKERQTKKERHWDVSPLMFLFCYRNLISAGTGSYNTGTAFGSGFLRGLAVWFFILIICFIANGEGVCGIHMGGTGSVCIEGVGNTVDGAGGSCIHDTGRRIKVVGASVDILETGLHLAIGSE